MNTDADGRILFFKQGSFSQQNDFIEAQLVRRFPGCSVQAIDVWNDVLRQSIAATCSTLAAAVLEYPRSTLGRLCHPRVYAARTRPAGRELLKWSGRNRPSQLLFTFQTQSIFDAALPATPHVVYTDHTYLANFRYADRSYQPEVPSDWVQRERRLYSNARLCLTTSTFATASLIEDYGIDAEKVVTIFCGANATRTPQPPQPHPDVVRILFVGIEWERKGGPQLLDAFKLLRSKIPNVELWIAGPTHLKCLPDGCRSFGRLPLEDIMRCFSETDIFCLPSRREPSAVVLSEALANGLPIVASHGGGTPDRVQDGRNGFLIDPRHPSGLVAALETLCLDGALRIRMGRESLALSAQHFTWDAVGEKMAVAIRGMLARQ